MNFGLLTEFESVVMSHSACLQEKLTDLIVRQYNWNHVFILWMYSHGLKTNFRFSAREIYWVWPSVCKVISLIWMCSQNFRFSAKGSSLMWPHIIYLQREPYGCIVTDLKSNFRFSAIEMRPSIYAKEAHCFECIVTCLKSNFSLSAKESSLDMQLHGFAVHPSCLAIFILSH